MLVETVVGIDQDGRHIPAGERVELDRADARRHAAKGRGVDLSRPWLISDRQWAPAHVFPEPIREAWILAAGESLAEVAPRIPADAVTFAVNRVHPGAPALAGAPVTYWVTCDPGALEQHRPAARGLRARFGTKDQLKAAGLVGQMVGVPVAAGPLCGSGLSMDWAKGVCAIGGSAYVALQLALMAGARHVHLAGLDFGGDYFDGSRNTPGKYERQLVCFRLALEVLRAQGIRWTNHSRGPERIEP